MGYRVIYIDDDFEEAQTLKDGLQTGKLIEITVVKANNFENQLDEIIKSQESCDGLILDLKLDGNQDGERKANYTAPSLAQQLRSKSSEEGSNLGEFPIFLFTSKDKLPYYISDIFSHDLFDEYFLKKPKSGIGIGTEGKEYEKKIASIISAYKRIEECSKYNEILHLELDETIRNKVFINSFDDDSTSFKSNFILKHLVKKTGLLIDERILAARLGVDLANSIHWKELKELLNETKYQGIFSDYYERWWMYLVQDWWKANFKRKNLMSLTATQRVKLLRELMKDKLKEKYKPESLVIAKPLPKTSSERFWTICQKLEKPLDPNDGFRLKKSNPKIWQDMEYVSLHGFEETEIERKDIHPTEKERFKRIKKQFSNE